MLTITPVTYEDLPRIAALHVRVWQQTYPGQMPQSYLDNLDVDERLESWRRSFAKNRSNRRYGVLAAWWLQEIVGFLSYGLGRDVGCRAMTEIYAINILKEYWGKGIGHQLFNAVRAPLQDEGVHQAYLWVLESNRQALAAYQRWGGVVQYNQTKRIDVGGVSLKEIRVTFDFA